MSDAGGMRADGLRPDAFGRPTGLAAAGMRPPPGPGRGANARAVHPLTLRFRDAALERNYHAARTRFRTVATRISALAGAATWLGFGVLDRLTIRDPSPALLAVRGAGTVLLLALAAATVAVRPGRWVERAGIAALALNTGLLTLVMVAMSPGSLPYYPPGAVFTTAAVTCFAFCGVTFVEGALLALLPVCAFVLSVTRIWPEPWVPLTFHGAWMLSVLGFAGVGCYLLDRTQRVAWLRETDLAAAEDRIRSLVHTLLPPSIAARKLAGESPIADDFPEACILFSDIAGFTALSARLDSTQVAAMLGTLYGRFDRIVARHGLEKIKTIGDCYMVAGGIPEPHPDHLDRLARAALAMMDEAAATPDPDGCPIALRIGMHTGPVTAGVIGEARFTFDVWGDTVNLASRMESHGAPGRIQVTGAVRAALAGRYAFEGPQSVDVKGKGMMEVWRLLPRAG